MADGCKGSSSTGPPCGAGWLHARQIKHFMPRNTLKAAERAEIVSGSFGHHHQGNANAAIGRYRVIQPNTLVWLANHELRLGWRDWIAKMTAGRRPMRNVAIALIIFGGFMHLLIIRWSAVTPARVSGSRSRR